MKCLKSLWKNLLQNNNQVEEDLKNQVEELSNQLVTVNRLLKDYQRKNKRLLKKQGEFKQQLKIANIKAVFWEEYSHKVLDRLEYLCFGSNLPRVMRQVDLQHYLKPNKKLLTKWFFDPNGVSIKLKGFEDETK